MIRCENCSVFPFTPLAHRVTDIMKRLLHRIRAQRAARLGPPPWRPDYVTLVSAFFIGWFDALRERWRGRRRHALPKDEHGDCSNTGMTGAITETSSATETGEDPGPRVSDIGARTLRFMVEQNLLERRADRLGDGVNARLWSWYRRK
jgi:hypothetical protein